MSEPKMGPSGGTDSSDLQNGGSANSARAAPYLLFVVVFDGVLISFLQPGEGQAHLSGPPDLGAGQCDLKTDRAGARVVSPAQPCSCSRLCAGKPGCPARRAPSPSSLQSLPCLGPGLGNQRSTAPEASPHRSPPPLGFRDATWHTFGPALGSAKPPPGDKTTAVTQGHEHL